MSERHVLACALALVGALASGAAAQRAKPTISPDMTSSHCAAIVRLQSGALETVTRAQQLAHARKGAARGHATAEIQHLRQAETALKTDPNTGLATGQRGTVLCNAQANRGAGLHKSPGRSPDALTVKQSNRKAKQY